MITYKPGEFAFSKSGHDKDNLYIIIKEDGELFIRTKFHTFVVVKTYSKGIN